MKKLFFLSTLFTLASCNPSAMQGFKSLEDATLEATATPAAGVVKIKSFTPASSPVVFTSTNKVTFAVSLNDGIGDVTFDYVLDGSQVLQSGTTPFLEVAGANLSGGNHTLRVKAQNAQSSDTHDFALRKNNAPQVISFNPVLSGNMINCGQDSLTMSAVSTDADGDSYTQHWYLDGLEVTANTLYTAISNSANSAQLAYTPACSVSGYHQITLVQDDSFEQTQTTWTVAVINPAVETLTGYYPATNNIVALSTESSKSFNASGTGVGTLTFTWTLDNVIVKTDVGVLTSNFILDTSSGVLATGDHTLNVKLQDSSTTNDPTIPAARIWTIYKNQKPSILTPNPSSKKLVNFSSLQAISANIQDALDTFSVSITKSALDCVPSTECGLSNVTLPTSTGAFSAIFAPGTTFLGENTFDLTVTDSHGESSHTAFYITANYFSDYCNNLEPGRICTLIGLPGLGGGLDLTTSSNKVRVTPTWMTQDENGNFFFSDQNTSTVWYYNALSTPVTLWANSTPSATVIPAKTLYVVAGTGVVGSGGNGQLARKMPFNFSTIGGALAWDRTRRELYISDWSNNRVVRIAQTGIASNFCGAGASSNTQGATASLHQCNNPVDLEFDNVNKRLYVSSYNTHYIKYFDTSDNNVANWKGYLLAGAAGTASNTDGTTNLTAFPSTTIAGSSRLNGPLGLYLDTSDNILYFVEYHSCRLRAIGLPGAMTRTVLGTTITAGSVVSLAGNAGCASTNSPAPANIERSLSSILFYRPMDVLPYKTGGTLLGLLVSDRDGNRINFLNNSASSITLGNQTVSSMMVNNIWGNGVSSPTNPPTGKNSVVVTPYGLYLDGSTLYVGAKGNNALKTLNVGTSNGAVAIALGGTARASYSGNTPLDSQLVTLNNPLSLMYRNDLNTLYFSDSGNAMIRSIHLTTGRVEDFIGTGGSGGEDLANTVTTATRIRSARAMAMFGSSFLYADTANNNCFIRAYNPLSTDQNIFNTMVSSNRTNTIAGYFNWCSNFVGTSQLPSSDSNAQIGSPYGIGVDEGTDTLYISSNSSHCILKLTQSGLLSPLIGSCGTAAGTPSYGGSIGDSSFYLANPAELVMDPRYPGNFFFVDFSAATTSHVKYVNLTETSGVSFWAGGTFVGNQEVGTVLADTSSPGYIRALAAFDAWICFTSGTTTAGQGDNTIVCRNRDDGVKKVFGVSGAGGIQLEKEHEGASVDSASSLVTFAAPSGLAFDSSGNLYISEQGAHVIRMIKRWW